MTENEQECTGMHGKGVTRMVHDSSASPPLFRVPFPPAYSVAPIRLSVPSVFRAFGNLSVCLFNKGLG